MSRPSLPPAWRDRVVASACALAIGQCETTPNRGQIPEHCQRTAGGSLGEYWCMDFAVTAFVSAVRLACPLLRSGSCEQQRQRAVARGALRTRQQFDEARRRDPRIVAGWLFLCIGPDEAGKPHAHHTGIVGVIGDDGAIQTAGRRGGFLTCEGNAADPEKPSSRNGDGAYRGRERGHPDDLTHYEFISPEAL